MPRKPAGRPLAPPMPPAPRFQPEHVAALRAHARDPSTPATVAEAIALGLDHIAHLEQALVLMESSVASAARDRPANVIIGVGR